MKAECLEKIQDTRGSLQLNEMEEQIANQAILYRVVGDLSKAATKIQDVIRKNHHLLREQKLEWKEDDRLREEINRHIGKI